MDPQAALDAAESAINDGDKAEAREYLANYASWRRNGGFQPAGGDARHASLLKRLRSRKRVSKNSRKARLRHNVEGEGGMNWLLIGGLAVGGYFALRWFQSKPSGSPSVSSSIVSSSKPSADAGWAAYQSRPGAAEDTFKLSREEHDQFWNTLTDSEKQQMIRMHSLPESQRMEAAQNPANAPLVGKAMTFTFQVMAQRAQSASPATTPPNSSRTSAAPDTGVKGIGNYFNDGD